MSRSGAALGLCFVACWSGRPATQAPIANLESGARDVTGPYWCSIDHDGFDYPRYPCLIKKVHGRLMLGKLGGSQRIRGDLVLDSAEGFEFVGELYCPWGDCTEELRGRFKPTGRGGWTGTLHAQIDGEHRDEAIVVHLTPAPANAFAGQGYGGDGYGDPFAYGGASYGARSRPPRH